MILQETKLITGSRKSFQLAPGPLFGLQFSPNCEDYELVSYGLVLR